MNGPFGLIVGMAILGLGLAACGLLARLICAPLAMTRMSEKDREAAYAGVATLLFVAGTVVLWKIGWGTE